MIALPRAARALAAASVLALSGAAGAGEIRGVVRFDGAAPALPAFPVVKDRAACGEEQPDPSLRVVDGRLADVVVTLRGAGLAPPKPGSFTLDQRGCRFVPHVLVAPVGSTLEVVNGDPVLHGVRGRTGRVTRFDLPLAGAGDRARTRLDRAGPVAVGCDVHAWMTAWVVVVDAPAALAADGTFTLRNVPAGRYTLAAWHERLGERSAEVVVPADGAARVELAYGERRAAR